MKRLVYIPGLLSLGLLLPLCLWYLYRQGVWQQERCITMTFPIPQEFRDAYDFPQPPTPREARVYWTEFACGGDHLAVDAVLLAFRDSLRELESREDTIRGVHLHFGPDTKYETIINAIDICRTTVMFWSLDDHDLWTGHRYESKSIKLPLKKGSFELFCGTNVLSGSAPVPQTPNETVEAVVSPWAKLVRPYWMSWSLFVVIGVLAIRAAFRSIRSA
jgi:hypothetical protein